MEADFQRFYDIQLNKAVWKDGMTLRRFFVLLRGLPYDSAWNAFYENKQARSLATYNPDKLTVR